MSYGYELQACDGPVCPRCGCRDSKILRQPDVTGSWWGGGKARCRHCGLAFSFREIPKPPPPPEVPVECELPEKYFPGNGSELAEIDDNRPVDCTMIPIVTCPDCGDTMKTSSTRKKFRYHKCLKCGRTLKTAR